MDLEIGGQVAVVTGGGAGIGRAIASALAEEGAKVATWDIAITAAGSGPRTDVAAAGPLAEIHADVTDYASVQRAATETVTGLGPIDHLIHCAAIGSGKYGFPFTNLEPDDWWRVLQVNIMGMVHVAHAVAPAMRDRGSGTLTFLASVAGQIGSQTDPPYSAAKAANINFAQCLARDLAPHGVRVNTVCPGMVKTALNQSVWRAWYQQQGAEEGLSYEQWADEKIRRVVPLGTWQRPEDIADMVLMLVSNRAAQVTGQTINVDGGFVMHW